ncbi:MAG: hypothetical protein R3E39_25810 [Anaerolineae bacterium]
MTSGASGLIRQNSIEVVIDGRFIYYDFSEADELTLAYCISTHRSKVGSTRWW